MNREQTLAVLYDLTLTIGSEFTVDELCRKVLQRMLFHTGFPAGVAVLKCAADSPLRLKYSLGDHVLAQRQGQAIELPAELLTNPSHCWICRHGRHHCKAAVPIAIA